MAELCSFWVSGIPKPGGSKTAFPIKTREGKTKVIVTDASKGAKDWKLAVKDACQRVFYGPPTVHALNLTCTFYQPYRKQDFNPKTGQLRENAPTWHDKKPDLTKLLRSTEDALTGILWHDDSQVIRIKATKQYGLNPGAKIVVELI